MSKFISLSAVISELGKRKSKLRFLDVTNEIYILVILDNSLSCFE